MLRWNCRVIAFLGRAGANRRGQLLGVNPTIADLERLSPTPNRPYPINGIC